MLRLTNLADYAVVAMIAAARAGARTSTAEIARTSGIPAPTAAKLTGILTRAGLLEAARGSQGGVRLASPPAEISLTDIVEAIDGPIGLTQCLSADAKDCALTKSCTVRPHWSLINETVRGALGRVTLADILQADAKAPQKEVA